MYTVLVVFVNDDESRSSMEIVQYPEVALMAYGSGESWSVWLCVSWPVSV
jgi:hypothetical protein